MKKALAWVSFDYDLTITSSHTWKDLKATKKDEASRQKAAAAKLINPRLLANLIEFICSRGIVFCITTLQFEGNVVAGMRAHPPIAAALDKYMGTLFFIIDRDEVKINGNKKSVALHKRFCTSEKFTGIHFDDDDREQAEFAAYHIHFQPMTPGAGFQGAMTSTLCSGMKMIPAHFSNQACATNVPAEGVYANTAVSAQIPDGHDFKFKARRSAEFPIGQFVSDLMVTIMNS